MARFGRGGAALVPHSRCQERSAHAFVFRPRGGVGAEAFRKPLLRPSGPCDHGGIPSLTSWPTVSATTPSSREVTPRRAPERRDGGNRTSPSAVRSPLDGAARVAVVRQGAMRSDRLPRPALLWQPLVGRPVPARVRVIDRNAANVPGGCPGPGRIVGRIHGVAERDVPPALMAESRIAAWLSCSGEAIPRTCRSCMDAAGAVRRTAIPGRVRDAGARRPPKLWQNRTPVASASAQLGRKTIKA